MCGISAIVGQGWSPAQLEAMLRSQRHRGPDAQGTWLDPSGTAGLAQNRLSIIDLSAAGNPPMPSADGRYWIIFNGEIYNYRELRRELADYPYRSQTDTEVLLAAYEHWGPACLERLLGMFALAIWDTRQESLFAARDRFGVKPLYYHQRADGSLWIASEIKALHAAGVAAEPDAATWATYLAVGLSDHSERTFWQGVGAVPPGHTLLWQNGRVRIRSWYDVAERTGDAYDPRSEEVVAQEYLGLLQESVRLRFRADVPVGIALSGGVDSSTLLGLVGAAGRQVECFTFTCGDPAYDETPWIAKMLARTGHSWRECRLRPEEVPDLARQVQSHQDEPFGGLPTLAYARLFSEARAAGVVVLLDGQGMDEQWAGYDYYLHAPPGRTPLRAAAVQGDRGLPVRPDALRPEFRALAEPASFPCPYPDALRNLQYRDARYTKIPRALRFNDRVSMRASTELREPFLDHRLFELAMRQPPERKIACGRQKWLLRRIARQLLPEPVLSAPKRALQTPQREWLRGPLAGWVDDCIERALARCGDWLVAGQVRRLWRAYRRGEGDSSFHIWQWVSLALSRDAASRPAFPS